jgi:hypothetical protein
VDWILLVLYRYIGERDKWEGGVIYGLNPAGWVGPIGDREMWNGGVDFGLDPSGCVEVQWGEGQVGGWRNILIG